MQPHALNWSTARLKHCAAAGNPSYTRLLRSRLPIIGMLAGVGVIAAGDATLQIPLIGAGIGVFGTAAAKLSKGPSGKKKDKLSGKAGD
jgi:hypothetical protein